MEATGKEVAVVISDTEGVINLAGSLDIARESSGIEVLARTMGSLVFLFPPKINELHLQRKANELRKYNYQYQETLTEEVGLRWKRRKKVS